MLNIDHIPPDIPDVELFDDILICPYLDKVSFLVIVVMYVELSTFIGYTCARYGNLGCGFINILAVR